MAEGEGLISRVLHRFGGKPTSLDQQAPAQDPTLGRANVLDQAARSMDVPQGIGGIRTTPPTAEGLARAQDAVASTQPTPPAPGTPTQGS